MTKRSKTLHDLHGNTDQIQDGSRGQRYQGQNHPYNTTERDIIQVQVHAFLLNPYETFWV